MEATGERTSRDHARPGSGGEAGATSGGGGDPASTTADLFAALATQLTAPTAKAPAVVAPSAPVTKDDDPKRDPTSEDATSTSGQLPAALLAAMMAAASTLGSAGPAITTPSAGAEQGAVPATAPAGTTTTPAAPGSISSPSTVVAAPTAASAQAGAPQTDARVNPLPVGQVAPQVHDSRSGIAADGTDRGSDGPSTRTDGTGPAKEPAEGSRPEPLPAQPIHHAADLATPLITIAPTAVLQAPTATHAAAAVSAATPARHTELADRVEAANPDPNVARLGSLVRTARRGDVHTASLELTPPELGHVQVELRTHDGVVSLHVTAVSGDGAAAIRNAVAPLRRELEAAGIALGTVDVNVGGGASQQSGHDGDDTGSTVDPDVPVRGLARPRGRAATNPNRSGATSSGPGPSDPTAPGVDVDL